MSAANYTAFSLPVPGCSGYTAYGFHGCPSHGPRPVQTVTPYCAGWICPVCGSGNSLAHNAKVGGVQNSEHTRGLAADISVKGMTSKELYAAAKRITAFRGIGVDEHREYVHVDVRPTFARWCYDASGKPCAWDRSLDEGTSA